MVGGVGIGVVGVIVSLFLLEVSHIQLLLRISKLIRIYYSSRHLFYNTFDQHIASRSHLCRLFVGRL